jgi:hypothetical protein
MTAPFRRAAAGLRRGRRTDGTETPAGDG